jgi:hypothetical protein
MAARNGDGICGFFGRGIFWIFRRDSNNNKMPRRCMTERDPRELIIILNRKE